MKIPDICKLVGLNLGIVLVDAFCYINLIAEENEWMAVGWGIIAVSVLGFCMGNYKIISNMQNQPEQQYGYVLGEIDTAEECIDALSKNKKAVFRNATQNAIEQVHTLQRKKKAMSEVLFQQCNVRENEESGYEDVIQEAEQLLYGNIRHMLSRMSIFDEQGYAQLMQRGSQAGTRGSSYLEQRKLFEEHIRYVNQQVEKNDGILLEFDRLLTEISKLSDEQDDQVLENMKNVVAGMKALNSNTDQELSQLEKKYQQ